MAGGYDGSKMWPESEMSSTLKLVNDESFKKGTEVSMTCSYRIRVAEDTPTF